MFLFFFRYRHDGHDGHMTLLGYYQMNINSPGPLLFQIKFGDLVYKQKKDYGKD